jgi:hypothetical protein
MAKLYTTSPFRTLCLLKQKAPPFICVFPPTVSTASPDRENLDIEIQTLRVMKSPMVARVANIYVTPVATIVLEHEFDAHGSTSSRC